MDLKQVFKDIKLFGSLVFSVCSLFMSIYRGIKELKAMNNYYLTSEYRILTLLIDNNHLMEKLEEKRRDGTQSSKIDVTSASDDDFFTSIWGHD